MNPPNSDTTYTNLSCYYVDDFICSGFSFVIDACCHQELKASLPPLSPFFTTRSSFLEHSRCCCYPDRGYIVSDARSCFIAKDNIAKDDSTFVPQSLSLCTHIRTH